MIRTKRIGIVLVSMLIIYPILLTAQSSAYTPRLTYRIRGWSGITVAVMNLEDSPLNHINWSIVIFKYSLNLSDYEPGKELKVFNGTINNIDSKQIIKITTGPFTVPSFHRYTISLTLDPPGEFNSYGGGAQFFFIGSLVLMFPVQAPIPPSR